MKAVRLRELSVELGNAYERVIGTQHHSGIRRRQLAEAIDEGVFELPGGLDCIVALADVNAEAFVIGAVENCFEINQAVLTRLNYVASGAQRTFDNRTTLMLDFARGEQRFLSLPWHCQLLICMIRCMALRLTAKFCIRRRVQTIR